MLDLPLNKQTFFDQHFEQQPAWWRKAATLPVLSWNDLDHSLQSMTLDDTALQMHIEGQQVPLAHISSERRELNRTRRVLDKHRFVTLLHQGASLVLNRFEEHSVLTRQLCDEVARFTGVDTSCNSYVTWCGNGAFGKHWDTHDVMVVQLIGRKHWRVFAPTLPLPLSHQTSRFMNETTGMTCPAQSHMDVVLEAGDVLYLPRGWWHEVTPMNTGSWHLAIGIYTPTMQDYLQWLVKKVLPTHEAARRGALVAPNAKDMAEVMTRFTQVASDPLTHREFLRESQQAMVRHSALNTQLLMPDATLPAFDQWQVSRATPPAINLSGAEIITPTGTLRLDTLKRQLLTLLNEHDAMRLDALMQAMQPHPASLVYDVLRQLAVLEVITLEAVVG